MGCALSALEFFALKRHRREALRLAVRGGALAKFINP